MIQCPAGRPAGFFHAPGFAMACSLDKFGIELPDGAIFVVKSTPFMKSSDREDLFRMLAGGSFDRERVEEVVVEFAKQHGYSIQTRVIRP
jgi:hypothetical protein